MGVEPAAPSRRAASSARAEAHVLTPAEAAWLGIVPCALALVAAIDVLGPALGRAFLAPGGDAILPGIQVLPEPAEHGRYVVALLAPLLLAAVVATLGQRRVGLPRATVRALVAGGQALTFGFVVVCLLAQYDVVPGAIREPWSPFYRYFTPPTLATAGLFTVLLAAVLRSRRVVGAIVRGARETRLRRHLSALAAVALAADWLLRSVNSDRTIGFTHAPLNLLPWEMSDAFAVLDGRTPLVDYHAMYSHLSSYPVAGAMALTGASLASWTSAMAVLSGLGILAVFAVLRRVVRHSLLALALYAPFVAIGFWVVGSPREGTSLASVFSLWPLRYGGPYVLAWLTARHVDRVAPRRAEVLFLLAGLVLVNNLEFGLAAFAATLAALALGSPPRSPRAWARLAASAAIGLAGALVVVAALTLARTGELPRFGGVLEFPRLFGVDGWLLEPMPVIGLHIAMYVTFVAAIAVAVVRAAVGARERVLTSMLGWAGVFGLLAGTYYVGRSDPPSLESLFSAWSLALALLLVVVVRDVAARPRLPALPQLAVIFGFGLAIGSLPNTPGPAAQIARLGRGGAPPPLLAQLEVRRFVAARTRPGERVVILTPSGFRVAHDLGLANVSPYSSAEAIPTSAQLRTTVDAARRWQVRRVFVKALGVGEESENVPSLLAAFERAGFSIADREPQLTELVGAATRR